MRIKAVILREINGPVRIEEIEIAPPKRHEVLVRTAYTGFCHSDLSMIKGIMKMPLPLVMGHEASGIVADVGEDVTSVEKGDHVVATWMIACGHCPECRKGLGHICRNSFAPHDIGALLDMTSRLTDLKGNRLNHQTNVSGFAEYMVLPEAATIKIRKDLPLDQASFLGCALPTGFSAVYNAAQLKPGHSVAIWGLGGVGLNVVRGAKLRGGNPIIGIDLMGSKEGIAREFGVTHFVNNSKDDPVPIVKGLTDDGADFCFEASGDSGAITQAYWALGMGGKLIQIGLTDEAEMTKLPLFYHPLHCKSVIGALYGNIETHREIPALADLAVDGILKLDKLVGKTFRVEEINEVAEAIERREVLGRWVCAWD